jgi:hypothetical protein
VIVVDASVVVTMLLSASPPRCRGHPRRALDLRDQVSLEQAEQALGDLVELPALRRDHLALLAP